MIDIEDPDGLEPTKTFQTRYAAAVYVAIDLTTLDLTRLRTWVDVELTRRRGVKKGESCGLAE